MAGGAAFPAITLAQANAALTAPGSAFEIEERDIRGVRTRVWKNAPPTMREVFLLGRSHGDRTFVVYRDERASYESFARAALAIAEALQQAGVKKGDRVAIAMRNVPEWPAAFFGCLLVGGVATLLNAWWTGPGARIRAQRFRSQGRDRRSRKARADFRASAQLSGARAHLRQPRA